MMCDQQSVLPTTFRALFGWKERYSSILHRARAWWIVQENSPENM